MVDDDAARKRIESADLPLFGRCRVANVLSNRVGETTIRPKAKGRRAD
jgi:hypothetical protein